jgi:hypothetical protein
MLKMLQLALLNRVPFGKFNRASAFPVACYGVSERTAIKLINSLHFEDSLQLAAGSFNFLMRLGPTKPAQRKGGGG